MYCKYCGVNIADNSIYCNTCGKKQTDTSNSHPPIQGKESTSTSMQTQSDIVDDAKAISKPSKKEIKIASETVINLKLLMISVIIGIISYIGLRYGYFQAVINRTVSGSYIQFNVLTEGMPGGVRDVEGYITRNAENLSQQYAFSIFIISMILLVLGRYIIKGLSWATKTSKVN